MALTNPILGRNQLGVVLLALATGAPGCGAEDRRSEEHSRGDTPGSNTVVVPLIVGKDTAVIGEVQVWLDGNFLHTQYVTEDDWQLAQTHLALGETLGAIPTNAKGCPKLGKFAWSDTLDPWVDAYEVVVDLAAAGLDDAEELVIAAHAEVQSGAGKEDGAWADGASFPGCPSIAKYFTVDLDDLRGPAVDLAVTALEITPSIIHGGDGVSRWFMIRNDGTEPYEGAMVVKYWLSQDSVFGGDIDMGGGQVFGPLDLEPGASFGWVTSSPVVAEDGQYWVFIEIQPEGSPDVDPTNNVRMDDDPLVITEGPLPISDLAVTGVWTSPHVIDQGGTLTLHATTMNLGPDPFEGVVTFWAWASKDLLLGPEDFPVVGGWISRRTLPVGAWNDVTLAVSLPALPPDDYHFIAEVSTFLGGPDPNLDNQWAAEEALVTVNP